MIAPSAPYLRFSAAQRFGYFRLELSFDLTDPWTVLFGPPGGGKTSVLRLIAGLPSHGRKPARAQIVFHGQTLADVARGIWVPPARRGIGFVTQRPALFPHMNVAANIGFGLHGIGASVRRQRVAELLRIFALEPVARRRPKALTAGERQRVALARALAPNPRLLLLDEPFAGVEPALKPAILANLIGWLGERQIPALYVTRDLVEVLETGAEVIVLREGKMEAQGPARMVLAKERERLLRRLNVPRTDGPRWNEADLPQEQEE